jgi:hypothetical protein
MNTLLMIAALLGLQDFDVAKVERKLKSEPRYQGIPKYALLVVGTEGKIRIWMSLDGGVLYVDRDGDGNLGEEGERFPAGNGGAAVGKIEFPGEKVKLEDFEVTTRLPDRKKDQAPIVSLKFRMNGRVTVSGGCGPAGAAEWGGSLEKAPVLHADPFGPLTFLYTGAKEFAVGAEGQVTLNVGSMGAGPSTFCAVDDQFLDLNKDRLRVTLIAKDREGIEIRRPFLITGAC